MHLICEYSYMLYLPSFGPSNPNIGSVIYELQDRGAIHVEIRVYEDSDLDEFPTTAHIDETDEAAVRLNLTLSQISTMIVDEY